MAFLADDEAASTCLRDAVMLGVYFLDLDGVAELAKGSQQSIPCGCKLVVEESAADRCRILSLWISAPPPRFL